METRNKPVFLVPLKLKWNPPEILVLCGNFFCRNRKKFKPKTGKNQLKKNSVTCLKISFSTSLRWKNKQNYFYPTLMFFVQPYFYQRKFSPLISDVHRLIALSLSVLAYSYDIMSCYLIPGLVATTYNLLIVNFLTLFWSYPLLINLARYIQILFFKTSVYSCFSLLR